MSIEIAKIIRRQKIEWDEKRRRTYVPRLQTDKARAALSSDLIKVIMGPRRAGKSVLAAIVLKDTRSAYFNFDEISVFSGLDTEQLVPLLLEIYGPVEYLFFDEIQNLPGWQLFLNRLQREGYNLIVSGSNANLLSGELATHLTGRYESIEVFPFCFSELIQAKNAGTTSVHERLKLADEFLHVGGYPEVVLSQGIDRVNYVKNLVEAVIHKDVVTRHSLRKPNELAGIADWMFSSVSKEATFSRLAAAGSDAGLPKSMLTAKRYVAYLEEAYLVQTLGRYDSNHRERLRSPKKVYAVDNGVALAMGFRSTPDEGRLLENLVYSELRKWGKFDDLRYFKTPQGDREVDFVIREKYETVELIQSVWDISDPKTLKRELLGLASAIRSTRCKHATLVTWTQQAEFSVEDVSVRAVPFHVWASSLSLK
jgi:hypothetical protein